MASTRLQKAEHSDQVSVDTGAQYISHVPAYHQKHRMQVQVTVSARCRHTHTIYVYWFVRMLPFTHAAT